MKDAHDRGFKYFWIVLKKNNNTLLMLKIRVKLSLLGHEGRSRGPPTPRWSNHRSKRDTTFLPKTLRQ